MSARGPHRCLLHVAGQFTVGWPQRDLGRKTYCVRVRDEFTGRVIKLGTGQLTPRKAQEVGRIWAQRQAQVISLQPKPLLAAFEEWLSLRHVRDVTLKSYRSLANGLNNHLGSPLTSSISAAQFQTYLTTLRTPGTRQTHISVLRAFFRWAIEKGYSPIDPTIGSRPGRKKHTVGVALTPEEARALVSICDPHLRTAVLLALYTGLRRKNVRNLKWSDIDLSSRTIRVPAADMKTHADTILPIHKDLAAYLSTRQGKPLAPVVAGPTSHFKAVAAEIRPMRFHDLRHTFSTWCSSRTRNYALVKQLRGDVVTDVARSYIHFSHEDLLAAVDLLPWVGPSRPAAAPATPQSNNTGAVSRPYNMEGRASSPSPGSAAAARRGPQKSTAPEYTL